MTPAALSRKTARSQFPRRCVIVPASPAELHQPQPAAPHPVLETALKVTDSALASPARATSATAIAVMNTDRTKTKSIAGNSREASFTSSDITLKPTALASISATPRRRSASGGASSA